MKKYLEFCNAEKVVVEVDKIIELFSGQCPESGCNGVRTVSIVSYGTIMIFRWVHSSYVGSRDPPQTVGGFTILEQ